jgi:hypothetical protein
MNIREFVGKKRLHLFQDEKVVNDAINFFEKVFPDENIYVVLTKDGVVDLVKEQPNTFFLLYDTDDVVNMVNAGCGTQEIIVHSMGYRMALIVGKLNHPNITWVIWGGDLFEPLLKSMGYKLYLDGTPQYMDSPSYMPFILYKFKCAIKEYLICRTIRKAISRINNIATTTGTTYDLFLRYFPQYKRINKKEFFYYPIEKMLDDDIRDAYVSGKDIWINNAAHSNGNHVYIFNLIKKYNNNSIHVPLSYGDSSYASYVEKEGKNMFGKHFCPMLSFIPRNDYYKRFLNSNSFIFGHLRSCAIGNIIIALYLGAKVFLFKDNPAYMHFKNMGIAIFSIDEELTEENLYSSLSETDRKRNRELILEKYSMDRLLNVIKSNF